MLRNRSEIDLNPQFRRALALMEETKQHVFVTGRAGTGKSTLLGYFREHTAKRVVFLAPTGVAAVNISGQTIHSFFGFRPDVTPSAVRKKIKDDEKNLYKKITAIVIDEVSMVRADLLDCMDTFLRLNGPDGGLPFGGIQMIFIGDLYQLPPVVTSQEREIFRTLYATPFFSVPDALSGWIWKGIPADGDGDQTEKGRTGHASQQRPQWALDQQNHRAGDRVQAGQER